MAHQRSWTSRAGRGRPTFWGLPTKSLAFAGEIVGSRVGEQRGRELSDGFAWCRLLGGWGGWTGWPQLRHAHRLAPGGPSFWGLPTKSLAFASDIVGSRVGEQRGRDLSDGFAWCRLLGGWGGWTGWPQLRHAHRLAAGRPTFWGLPTKSLAFASEIVGSPVGEQRGRDLSDDSAWCLPRRAVVRPLPRDRPD